MVLESVIYICEALCKALLNSSLETLMSVTLCALTPVQLRLGCDSLSFKTLICLEMVKSWWERCSSLPAKYIVLCRW